MKSLRVLFQAVAVVSIAACASSGGANNATVAPTPDPRVGLKPGLKNAGRASWNLRLVDITSPSHPTLKAAYFCPASQSDVSVFRNLLFVSGEGTNGRLDCSAAGVHDSVSHDRLRGIRIFDITDITNPKYIANVQTCRGSHTHTVVVDPNDPANVYVYVSGSAPVRSPTELPGCVRQSPDSNPNSSLFRIEVIKVPLAAPQTAAIVSSPRIFDSLAPAPQHAEMQQDVVEAAGSRTAREPMAASPRDSSGWTA